MTDIEVIPTGTCLVITKEEGRVGAVCLLERKGAPGTYEIACMGPKRHFRRDGSCRCVRAVLAQMTDEARAATTIDPFGGKGSER